MSQDVQKVARHMDLLGAEVLAIYPARLTTGKRLEKVAALCGAIQKVSSRQTRAVFCDFPCADIPPDLYKKMIRTEGKNTVCLLTICSSLPTSAILWAFPGRV